VAAAPPHQPAGLPVRAATLPTATVGQPSKVGESTRQQCDPRSPVQRRIEKHIVGWVIRGNDLIESHAPQYLEVTGSVCLHDDWAAA
jgi:hypothetical protein